MPLGERCQSIESRRATLDTSSDVIAADFPDGRSIQFANFWRDVNYPALVSLY